MPAGQLTPDLHDFDLNFASKFEQSKIKKGEILYLQKNNCVFLSLEFSNNSPFSFYKKAQIENFFFRIGLTKANPNYKKSINL